MLNKFQQLVNQILENNSVSTVLGSSGAVISDPNIKGAMAMTGGSEPDKKRKKRKFPIIKRTLQRKAL